MSRSRAPGPSPTSASRPRGRRRATATVASALLVFSTTSSSPEQQRGGLGDARRARGACCGSSLGFGHRRPRPAARRGTSSAASPGGRTPRRARPRRPWRRPCRPRPRTRPTARRPRAPGRPAPAPRRRRRRARRRGPARATAGAARRCARRASTSRSVTRRTCVAVRPDGQRRQRPGGVGVQPHRRPVEHRPAHRRDGPLDRPAERVEAGQADGVGRGRDDGGGAEDVGDPAGELVGPSPVTADERDGEALRLVDDDDARVDGLVLQQRREQAHGRAGGQERHDARRTRRRRPRCRGRRTPACRAATAASRAAAARPAAVVVTRPITVSAPLTTTKTGSAGHEPVALPERRHGADLQQDGLGGVRRRRRRAPAPTCSTVASATTSRAGRRRRRRPRPPARPPPPTKTASGCGSPSSACGRGARDDVRRARRAAAALRRTRSASAGSRSTACTSAPKRAHSTATEPLPAPTSHTTSPRRGPRRASTTARTSGLVIIESRWSYASTGSAQPAGPRCPATVTRGAGSPDRSLGSTSTTFGSANSPRGGLVGRQLDAPARRAGPSRSPTTSTRSVRPAQRGAELGRAAALVGEHGDLGLRAHDGERLGAGRGRGRRRRRRRPTRRRRGRRRARRSTAPAAPRPAAAARPGGRRARRRRSRGRRRRAPRRRRARRRRPAGPRRGRRAGRPSRTPVGQLDVAQVAASAHDERRRCAAARARRLGQRPAVGADDRDHALTQAGSVAATTPAPAGSTIATRAGRPLKRVSTSATRRAEQVAGRRAGRPAASHSS